MAQLSRLKARAQKEIALAHFSLVQAANDARPKETDAAIRIQSAFRGTVVRARYSAVRRAAAMIARVVRGRMGRRRSAAKELERSRRWNQLFFHHAAEVVQKFFRGYWSRKYLHDFYSRRDYLNHVRVCGERTNVFLDKAFEKQKADLQDMEENRTRTEFDDLYSQLHHLVSTHQIPGVYNPPYSDTLPRAFDKPIESHLRDSCRVRLPRSLRRPACLPAQSQEQGGGSPPARLSGAGTLHKSYGGSTRMEVDNMEARPPQMMDEKAMLRKPLVSRTANVGRLQGMQGPFRSREQVEIANAKAQLIFKSVQASDEYDLMDEDRKMHERLSKLTRVSPNDFVAKQKVPNVQIPSVNAETKYLDRPVEFRSEYLELPKVKDKPPFFTALPRDKQFTEYKERELLSHSAV